LTASATKYKARAKIKQEVGRKSFASLLLFVIEADLLDFFVVFWKDINNFFSKVLSRQFSIYLIFNVFRHVFCASKNYTA
jgi:hypothetical protein